MYKILIITLLFFIPLSSFSQSPETCSLIQNSESNVPDNMPLSHIDFSNCNLVGLDLNDRNLSNADFSGVEAAKRCRGVMSQPVIQYNLDAELPDFSESNNPNFAGLFSGAKNYRV